LENKVASLRHSFQVDLKAVKDSKDVEQLKVKYLGKKGPIQELLMELRHFSQEDRPKFGKLINEIKQEIESLCDQASLGLHEIQLKEQLEREKIDVTIPGRRSFLGREHPISLVMDELLEIFIGMGFSVQLGPDIDSDYYNFEALNFAKDHPARDMQDTFYINQEMLLRTHTSNVQVRVMESNKPPIRVVCPGTVYRKENISARSHVFFHQIEGIYIDKDVSFADLFATMNEFCKKLFKREVKTRFRPSFFPFVEPGMELDVECLSCEGKGCRLCKQSGWLEVLGAGMVHPEVLKNGGIDPEIYTGYAWGMGIERLTMLRYGIKDIRLFFENDLRFLAQF
jgi:phenylalanyl-tRNA synthetase alpha chain